MSLAIQIGLYTLVAMTLVAWFIERQLTVNDSDRGVQVGDSLRSTRRRLVARHLRAEIHSTALRYRRELDDELNEADSENG